MSLNIRKFPSFGRVAKILGILTGWFSTAGFPSPDCNDILFLIGLWKKELAKKI
jgi:hypothetical protein